MFDQIRPGVNGTRHLDPHPASIAAEDSVVSDVMQFDGAAMEIDDHAPGIDDGPLACPLGLELEAVVQAEAV
jgi:hypothetical protein